MYSRIKRGDIFYCDLTPVVGSEQGGKARPVIVIQNDIGNRFSPTVIVASVTHKSKVKLPTHVDLSGISGLHNGSVALIEQIRTIDRSRLGRYIGRLESLPMSLVDEALAVSIGLGGDRL